MTSLMAAEIAEAPAVAARGLTNPALADVVGAIQALDPPLLVLCGRGSSGHAASYLRHLWEVAWGRPATIAVPSITTLYGRSPAPAGSLFVAISQSGQSPDLVQCAEAARTAGAMTVALVNVADSPLAAAVTHVVPLLAGPERSVAATKSVVAAMVAGAALMARLGDTALARALPALPEQLERALGQDWSAWRTSLISARGAFIAGRGPALGPARELALKLAECLGLPSAGYSSAELRHGPRGAITGQTPVLVLRQADPSAPGTDALVASLSAAGEPVFVAGDGTGGGSGGGIALPTVSTDHSALAPIAMLLPAYQAIEAAARELGRNPDHPRHLSKVTETV